MEHEARLDQRHVEAATVIGADRAVRLRPLLQLAENDSLVLEAGQQELAHANGRALECSAADQEGLRAGAAEQASGFEIEEHELAA